MIKLFFRIEQMTRKTKEKQADLLLDICKNLMTAVFVMLLVAPLGVIASILFVATPPVDILGGFKSSFSSILMPAFMFFEFAALTISLAFRAKGLELYNQLYPDEK